MEDMIIPILVLFVGLCFGLFFGLPMGFAMGTAGLLAGVAYSGPAIIQRLIIDSWSVMNNISMVAVPLYVFMAAVMEKSGIADDLYTAMHQWMGPLNGGLAMATIVICTIIAALSGVSAAGTVTMGMIALPIMLRKNYHKTVAIGPILVGGPLGLLIPPSIGFIIYGMLTQTSIGRLFAGGLFPGLILAGAYMTYIGIRCYIRPQDGPAIPKEERMNFKEKIILSRGLILPAFIILGVLGSIFAGIASPTEAAAVGALCSVLASMINRRFSFKMLQDAITNTAAITGMVIYILIGAALFSSVLIQTGVTRLIYDWVNGLSVNPIMVVIFMQATYFLLGFFFEETTMLFLTVPIYMPILVNLGFDPVWFGVLFMINLQTAFLTPPFGFSLFYLKGIAPPEITTIDIYKAVMPFILIQLCVLGLILIFPGLALWLPDKVLSIH